MLLLIAGLALLLVGSAAALTAATQARTLCLAAFRAADSDTIRQWFAAISISLGMVLKRKWQRSMLMSSEVSFRGGVTSGLQ